MLGIVPAAEDVCVVAAPDVARERVADYHHLTAVIAAYLGENGVKEFFPRLLIPDRV